jgi:Asp-tRNA(Asn)/Glu-tRNA(Gln) amidotransferase B subunit
MNTSFIHDASSLFREKIWLIFTNDGASFGNPRVSANYLCELLRECNNSQNASDSPVSPENLADSSNARAGKLTIIKRRSFIEMFASEKPHRKLFGKRFRADFRRSAIEKIVDEIIEKNENQVTAYRAATKNCSLFRRQVMKASQAKRTRKSSMKS